MAIHPDTKSLLKESVREYLFVAEYCISYKKDINWGSNQLGGCLGYPAALMLFSIVDMMGSYHRQNIGFKVSVGGRKVNIKSDGFQHFYVLNSDYYGQTLEEKTIKKLYYNFRSLLAHNAALPPNNVLISLPGPDLFPTINGMQFVNLIPFHKVSKMAVDKFINDIDKIVPGSKQEEIIIRKK
jgi:hypothetical protein